MEEEKINPQHEETAVPNERPAETEQQPPPDALRQEEAKEKTQAAQEKPAPAAAPAAAPQAIPQAEGPAQKKKKINEMSLKDIDLKLKDIKVKMGSFKSHYAKQLIRQKEILSGQKTKE